ncbi:MAG TPA: TonB-dependent receptor [Candidatus Koribacter sp.]|jgi:hypothetical protein
MRKLVAMLVLFLSTFCIAQNESATLSGRITDASGAVVPHAQVVLTNEDTNIEQRTITNGAGLYVFTAVHPGKYRVAAGASGFKTLIKEHLVLHVQDEFAENFLLTVGSVNESVSVNADAININTSDASVSTVVDSHFVENMPLNGRSFQSLIQLTPGVVITPASQFNPGQFSVNGQRTDTNYFTIDGVSANFGVTGGWDMAGQSPGGNVPALTAGGGTNGLVSVDAMEEFRIQTSTYAPEFGRSPGAQISILTKGGTNAWHGTGFDYLRNNVFDAREYFDNKEPILDNSGNVIAPALPQSPLRQNDFGGTIGGPIWKDHTFFFFSYEGLRLRQPATLSGYYFDSAAKATVPASSPWYSVVQATPTGPVPTPTGSNLYQPCDNVGVPCETLLDVSFSNPSSFNSYSLRLDQKLTDKISAFARYAHSPSQEGIYSPINVYETEWQNTDTATLGLTATLSPTMVDDFRGNWSRQTSGTAYPFLSLYGAVKPPNSALFPSSINPGNYLVQYAICAGSCSEEVVTGSQSGEVQRQVNLIDNVSKSIGSHQLKFGIDYRRLMPTEMAGSNLEPLGYSWQSITNGWADYVLNYTADQISAHINNIGLFAQDTWKATSRLTLTYGLRWDINPAPVSDSPGKPLYSLNGVFNSGPLALAQRPIWSTDYAAFGPRIGAAYQITPKTVVRAGFGLFYDLGFGFGGGSEIGGRFPYSRSTFDFSGAPLDFTTNPNDPVYQPIPFTTKITPGIRGMIAVNPDLRLPVTYQWNVAVERELGSKQSISATYVGSAGRELLFDMTIPVAALSNTIGVETNLGRSNYNSLQVQFMRRMSHGLQAMLGYTYSHSNDTASTEAFGTSSPGTTESVSSYPAPPMTPSDYDFHQRFSAAVSYEFPKAQWGGPAGRAIANGWALDSIYRLQSGPPLTVTYGYYPPDYSGGNVDAIAWPVAGQPVWIPDSSQPSGNALNPAAFTIKPGDISDFAERNQIRSPYAISQIDLAIRRRFNITERVKLDFRAEYFNLFNHPMFGGSEGPATFLGYEFVPGQLQPFSTFGKINNFGAPYVGTLNYGLGAGPGGGQSPTYSLGGSRSGQMTLKLTF